MFIAPTIKLFILLALGYVTSASASMTERGDYSASPLAVYVQPGEGAQLGDVKDKAWGPLISTSFFSTQIEAKKEFGEVTLFKNSNLESAIAKVS
jgi:hypothetical protein